MLKPFLEDLESRINPDAEEVLLTEWKRFLNGELKTGFFSPRRQKASPPGVEWPAVSVNEALTDLNRMVLQQLSVCSSALEGDSWQGSGAFMGVRSNYGTGVMPSVFGAEMFIMDERADTLPTTKPLQGGTDAIRQLLDKGIPDIRTGYGRRCLDAGSYFVELFADYPNISKYVQIIHPDAQGPMDICELLWGSDIFFELIDNPDLGHVFLDLITETYIRFMHEWEKIVPPQKDYAFHFGMMHGGRIMIRNDSAMNLSPEMFDEFIKPYDQRLLTEFNGGAVHFCGRGDHYIDRFHTMTGVRAINMSQPQCNDMERIFQYTIDKGIALIGLRRDAAEAATSRGRDLRGLVHSR
jgi:hypothetical protein